MKSFVKKYGDKPAIRALAGVFGDAFESLYKTRSTDKIFSMVPFILVTYELLQEPAAVALMIDGIESTDDLWAWIEYFNMPAEGWEGEGEPPRVDVGGDDDTEASAGSMLDWIIPTANAASPFRKKRINGTVLGKSIREAFEKNGADVSPKDVTGAIKSFSRALKSSQLIYLRKLVFNPVALQAIIRTFKTGRKNLQNFISGKSSARIPAPMVFAIMAYLQSEMAEGGRLNDPAIQTEIYNLYGDMFADVFFGKGLKEENGGVVVTKDGIEFVDAQAASLTGSAHGAMFHVAMIAYYTLLDELKAVEAERLVFSYDNNKHLRDGEILLVKRAYLRVVDIVLNDSSGAESWVELKSWRRHDVNKPFGVLSQDLMTMGGKPVKRPGGTSNYTKATANRQFHVDRMAGHLGTAFPEFFNRKQWRDKIVNRSDRFVDVSNNFKWWFQQFDVKSRTTKGVTRKAEKHPELGPKSNLSVPINLGKVRARLTELSYHGSYGMKQDRMEFSLGVKNRANDKERTKMANKIEIAKVVKLVFDQLKDKGLLDPALEDLLRNEFAELL